MSYFTNTNTVFVLTEHTNRHGIKTYSYFDFTHANLEAIQKFLYWMVGHKIIEASNFWKKKYFQVDHYEWCPVVNEEGEEEWDWHSYIPQTEELCT
jgi:hypothetical protein